MLQKLTLLALCFSPFSPAFAQLPPPCSSGQPPSEDCLNVCIDCSFDGLSGSNLGYQPDGASDFCSGIQNDLWIGLIAGGPHAVFTVTPSNCGLGEGLQIAIYASCGDSPISCNPGTAGGGNMPVSISASLIPGNNYYLLIDGRAADVCDFDLTVSPPGAAQAPPVGDNIGQMLGPSQLCPGGTYTFSVPPVSNASGYTWNVPAGWLVNGEPGPLVVLSPGGTSVQITAGTNLGNNLEICVQASNSCYPDGPTRCKNVQLQDLPVTTVPGVTVCQADLPYTLPWGVEVEDSGNYSATLESFYGCDSIVKQKVIVKPALITTLPQQTICKGSPFNICGYDFDESGLHQVVCSSYNGCDSTINFSLQVLEPFAQINGGGQLSCAANTLLLTAAPSPPGTVFTWKNLSGQVIGTGNSYVATAIGSYILNASLSGGSIYCEMNDTIVVLGDPTPPSLIVSDGELTCTKDSIPLNASSNLSNPSWHWEGPLGFVSDSTNPIIGVPGQYFVTVTAANGCSASSTFSITSDTISPELSVFADTLSCQVKQAKISFIANPTNVDIHWMGPGGFNSSLPAPQVSLSGTYLAIATNPLNGCTASANTQVAADTLAPEVWVQADTLTCSQPNGLLTGITPIVEATFHWSGPNSFSSNQPSILVTDAGSYSLTVIDPENGCSDTTLTVVLADQTPPAITSSAGDLSCDSTALIINTQSTLPALFSWTGPNNFNSSYQNPIVNEPGDYSLTVTALNGCTSISTVTILEDISIPDLIATGDTIDCRLLPVSLTATSSNGISFAWIGPNNFSSNLQNPSIQKDGIYTVTVTGTNGCTNVANAIVLLDQDTVSLSAVATAALACNTLAVNIFSTINTNNTGLQGLLWTGPNGFKDTLQNLIVSTPGIYTLTATTINGCTATASVEVFQNLAPPNAAAQGGVLTCISKTVQLNGTSAIVSDQFAWTGPNNFIATIKDPIVFLDGIYTLTVTGANGCSTTVQTTVLLDTIPPDLETLSSNNIDCQELSATLSAISQSSGAMFAWAGPNNFSDNSAFINVLIPGNYSVTATAVNGCSATSMLTLTQDIQAPSVLATGGVIDCLTGQVMIVGSSSNNPVSYAWTGPDNFVSSLQNPLVTQAGAYLLTVTGSNACTATALAFVQNNTLSPQVSVSGVEAITCTSPIATISGSFTPSDATGIWTGPNNFMAVEDSILVSLSGVYTFSVTAPNGCISTSSFTLMDQTQSPQGVVATGGVLNCNTILVQLIGNSDSPGVSYQWTGPGNFISNLQNPSTTNAGVYTLLVTDDTNGCTTSVTATVSQDPALPSISVSADTLTCTKTSVVLNALSNNINVLYNWLGPNGFHSNLEDPATNLPGLYEVMVTDTLSGCSATFTHVVLQHISLPEYSIQGDTLTCVKSTGKIICSSNGMDYSYTWTGPAGFTSSFQSPDVFLAGGYSVIVTGKNGCTSLAQVVVVSDKETPAVTTSTDTLTCANTSIVIAANSNTDVEWQWFGPGNFNSNLQRPIVSIPGNYTVSATASNGCVTNVSLIVAANTQSPEINIQSPVQLDCNTLFVELNASVVSNGPFNFQWNTLDGNILSGANSLNPTVNQAGQYELLATNRLNGCQSIESQVVISNENAPMDAVIRTRSVTCFGDTDGSAMIESVLGGALPYLFALDNNPYVTGSVFTALTPGIHTLEILDANGCKFNTSFVIPEPNEWLVNLGPDTTIHLGSEILISLDNIISDVSRVSQIVLSPMDLPIDSNFIPLQTQRYRITVIDSNGCKATDDRIITVNKSRWVYIPNVFKPNSTENYAITVFGGLDVERIRSFQIFDRWGEDVYSVFDFEQNELSKGWDGSYKGQPVSPGVFVYYAEVLFKDGQTAVFKGDITVVR